MNILKVQINILNKIDGFYYMNNQKNITIFLYVLVLEHLLIAIYFKETAETTSLIMIIFAIFFLIILTIIKVKYSYFFKHKNLATEKIIRNNLFSTTNLYNSLFHNSQFAQMIIDATTGNIITANQQASTVYHYLDLNLKNNNIENISKQPTNKKILEELHNKCKQKHYLEIKHSFKEKATKYSRIYPTLISIYHTSYLHLTIIDISKYKESQKLLLTSENRIRLALKGADLGYWDWNIKTGEEIFNSRLTEMLGYCIEQVDKNISWWKDKIHPDDREAIDKDLEDHFLGKTLFYENEHRLKHKSGEWIWILERGMVIKRDEVGNPLHMIGTHLDINEKKKHQEQQKLLKTVIEQSHDTVIIADNKGIIQYVNPTFSKTTGYSAEEAIGKHVTLLSNEPSKNKKTMDKIIETLQHSSWTGLFTNKTKSGEKYIEKAVISPIWDEKSKKITHFVSVQNNITETIEMQKQLLNSQKMQAIGTLSSSIAHDFNNILSCIIGHSEIALESNKNKLDISSNITTIIHASERAKELVNQILSFSKPSNDNSTTFNLVPLIKEINNLLQGAFPDNIKIKLEITTPNLYIYGNPSYIHQSIINICTNACHAMRDNAGTLQITLQNITIDENNQHIYQPNIKQAKYAQIIITDTGCGIDKNILNKIFDKYFTTKSPTEGTGLGLYNVKNMINSLHGSISVESKLEQGSSFTIMLPSVSAPINKRNNQHLAIEKAKKHNIRGYILVIDDEPLILTLYRKRITSLGLKIETFQNPHDGYQQILNNPDKYNLIITDYMMPNMTGIELAKNIYKQKITIPIILITGYFDQNYEQQAKETNIKEILYKPLDFNELSRIIFQLIPQQSTTNLSQQNINHSN